MNSEKGTVWRLIDLQKAHTENYIGANEEDLRRITMLILQRHKYVLYMLSVIRFHIGNQAHAMAIRATTPELFRLTPGDMTIHDSEIDLMLSAPAYAFKWSEANYGVWVKRFTQGLGPLSSLRKKYMHSAGYERFHTLDSTPYVRYTSPRIHSLLDKFNVRYRHVKIISWNREPIYDVESYFDLYFQEAVDEAMLTDFMESANWLYFVHSDRERFLDGVSAIITGYYKDGRPNRRVEASMAAHEQSEFVQLQNNNPQRTILAFLLKKLRSAR